MTGAEILQARLDLGLSQARFAQLVGCHAQTVSKWERELLPCSGWEDKMLRGVLLRGFSRGSRQSLLRALEARDLAAAWRVVLAE